MVSSVREEKQNQEAQAAQDLLSPVVCRIFDRYLNRYLPKNFHGVRIAKDGKPPEIAAEQGLVVYCNHPSWWDPLIMFFLSRTLFPERDGFGPIDAAALEKYKFMRKIGLFPVEQDTARGAVNFLHVSQGLLKRPKTSLWLTPQGQFTDARVRPVSFRPGIAHLARDCANVTFLPLAIECCFWNESKPELLTRFGTPIHNAGARDRALDEWQNQLQMALQTAQDKLAMDAMSRDPERFSSLLSGSAGVGFAYDAWRRVRALASGRRFSAAHEDE